MIYLDSRVVDVSRAKCKRSFTGFRPWRVLDAILYRVVRLNIPEQFKSRIMPIPENTKHLYNICTMPAQRLRRWLNTVQMPYKCFAFSGMSGLTGAFAKRGRQNSSCVNGSKANIYEVLSEALFSWTSSHSRMTSEVQLCSYIGPTFRRRCSHWMTVRSDV